MTELHVTFVDELTVVPSGGLVTFGRSADVTVDESNPYMHRIVGTFFERDNVWWLANKSRHASLTMVGDTGKVALLPPGAVAALAESSGSVRFEFGRSSYEVGWALPDREPVSVPQIDPTMAASGDATGQFGVVTLNEEQRVMLVALAERQLVDPSTPTTDLPANAAVAHRLGWTGKKLDRKLDYLCARLDAMGVRGLRGEKGVEAVDRRIHLVRHAISTGMIASSDLELLDRV